MGEDENKTGIAQERKEPRPDFTVQPPHKKLPKEIQRNLDSDERYWSVLYEGRGEDSTDSNARYAAYAARLRTILVSAHRYVAYTSEIGESFRPVAHPYLIRGAYAVSWLYLGGDVAHEGYKAYIKNQKTLHPETPYIDGEGNKTSKEENSAVVDTSLAATKDLVKAPKVVPIEDYRAVMAQRAVFQTLASMGLPAFTIHSIVRYSGRAMKNAKNTTIRTWGPIGLGLAAVPFLPFIFDKPVEHGVELLFHKGFELVGGKDAVGHGSEDKKEL